MELDRHLIERKDFPASKRGYDPDEVDAHLRAIANSVAELKQARASAQASIGGTAAQQVRGIVEAAEQSAAEIEERAQDEARRVTEGASEAAQRMRQQADAEAGAQLLKVEQATTRMLERASAVEEQVERTLDELRTAADGLFAGVRSGSDSLTEGLRGAAASVQSDLQDLRTTLGDLGSVRTAEPERRPESDFEDEALTEAEAPPAEAAAAMDEPAEGWSEGSEGARLIALNMALNGTPREETARYLQENFDLADEEALLDEVYARAGQA